MDNKNKIDRLAEEQGKYNRVPVQTIFKTNIIPGINTIRLFLN